MNNLSIKEKFEGMLFGYAIGDALGLGTEFMSRKEVSLRYPGGLTGYSQIIRDAHRSQWKKGEFSNDTLIVLYLLESILACNGLNFVDFAHRLKSWYLTGPIDMTTNLRLNLSQPEFSSKPFESARRVWSAKHRMDTTSECLGRALIAAIWNENIEDNVLQICRLTHPDSRCEVVCLILAKITNSLFWKNEEPSFPELTEIALVNHKNEIIPYLEMAHGGSLSQMELDDDDSFWSVRKALSAALWALWHSKSVEEGIDKVVAQGGDADTNASLAGALLGIKYGYSSLPAHLVNGLLEADKLHEIADEFTQLLTEKFC